jgi:uncharacterized integral membrane protein
MIIFLILGLILGAAMVAFVLQNITTVSVSFLTWHLDGSLAIILFLAFGVGVLMTLLFLLPSFIRDEWQYHKLKKHARAIEDELTRANKSLSTVGAPQPQPSMSEVPPHVG